MNKKDASAALQVSIRLVEKYASEGRLGEVKYVRGKTGKQADFDPASVEKLKAELESVDRQLIAPNRRAASLDGALSEQTPALAAFMDLVRGAMSSQVESLASAAEALRSAADTPAPRLSEKLTLSLMEASQLSGLSRRILRQAIEEKKLKARIIGRGWRMTRAALDAYVAKNL